MTLTSTPRPATNFFVNVFIFVRRSSSCVARLCTTKHEKALLTSVELPATAMLVITMLAMLVLWFCESLLNRDFGLLFQSMLGVQGLYGFVLLLPCLGFIGQHAYQAHVSHPSDRAHRPSDYVT